MLLQHAPLVLALGMSLASQQHVTVPSSAADLDASTGGRVAGFASRMRQQVLIDASEIRTASGRFLDGMAWRRDGQYQAALRGGQTSLRLRLSEHGRPVRDAVPSFVLNHGPAPAVVFDGPMQIPDAPALPHRDAAGWATPQAVVMPFAVPFLYTAGTLVVEVEGSPATPASAWWPVDHTADDVQGSVRPYGTRCGRFGNLGAPPHALRLGSTVRIASSGEARSSGAMLVGARDLVPGLSLAFLGAPACELAVQPDVMIPVAYAPYPADPTAPGFAGLHLHLPFDASLLRGRFFVQALDMVPGVPGNLTTTQGLELTLAAFAPPTACATIESFVAPNGPLPEQGLVQQGRMPVLRFAMQ